jgi:RNA polymerase sigma-70 factor (ECF subfamily)
MENSALLDKAKWEAWTDLEVIERVKAGDTAVYEILMRRYNQRLYRVARAILRDDGETEDVIQDAYVRAYEHLDEFRGSAPFSTWLTRIAINEALHRLRSRQRVQQLEDPDDDGAGHMQLAEMSPNPEQQASAMELGQFLEKAILSLPEQYRIVVMLRDVEELNTSETAAALELTEENVKVRLHRGRAMARRWLSSHMRSNAKSAFPFMGTRCDRVVANAFARLERELNCHSGFGERADWRKGARIPSG